MMNPEIKAKWVAALRSGDYDQCVGVLQGRRGYCCLGVLREIAGIAKDEDNELLAAPAAAEIGLTGPIQDYLAYMNDSGKTFAEIADHIEATL